MEKMTKREFLNAVATLENIDAELKLFAEQEIEKMDERNAKRKNSPSKTAIANEPIKAKIVEFVSGCEGRQLVEVGTLVAEEVKVKGKGKVKAYSLA